MGCLSVAKGMQARRALSAVSSLLSKLVLASSLPSGHSSTVLTELSFASLGRQRKEDDVVGHGQGCLSHDAPPRPDAGQGAALADPRLILQNFSSGLPLACSWSAAEAPL